MDIVIFKKRSRYVSLFLAIIILILSLSGCGKEQTESVSEKSGELSFADSSDNWLESESDFSSDEVQSETPSNEAESQAVSELTSNEAGSEVMSELVSDETQSEAVSNDASKESSENPSSEIGSEEASFESFAEESSNIQEASQPDESAESRDPNEPITPIPTLEADSIDSYFDKSVFIGYSIMMHFGKYVNQWRMDIDESIMGNSLFCCGVGMCFTINKVTPPDHPNSALPSYQGQKYNFEDLPKATGSDTIFVGLMVYSETKRSSAENCVNYAVNISIEGIQSIIDANPDVNVVVLSGTYNTGLYKTEQISPQRANNENVREYNSRVLKYCNKKGIDFIDVSTPLLNGYGYMPKEYSSDKDYHISKEPFKIWIHILRDYARAKQSGTWRNITEMPPLVQE